MESLTDSNEFKKIFPHYSKDQYKITTAFSGNPNARSIQEKSYLRHPYFIPSVSPFQSTRIKFPPNVLFGKIKKKPRNKLQSRTSKFAAIFITFFSYYCPSEMFESPIRNNRTVPISFFGIKLKLR